MTRYTVVWHDHARDQLARLWLAAENRPPITDAADAIDQELAHDPTNKGTAAEHNLRVLVVPPLRVLYSVSEPDRLVKVAAVALA